jgi:hypothetical protein
MLLLLVNKSPLMNLLTRKKQAGNEMKRGKRRKEKD